jgi:hypothetical protein
MTVDCLGLDDAPVRFRLLQSSSLCDAEQAPAFIIPALPHHTKLPLANYIDLEPDSAASLDVLLVLAVSSSAGAKVFLDTDRLHTCAINFVPAAEQASYPAYNVVARPHPLPHSRSRRRRPTSRMAIVPCIRCAALHAPLPLPSSSLIVSGTHALPPRGASPDADAEATLFLEAEAETQAQASSKVQWVASAVAAVMHPVIRIVEDQTAINSAASLSSVLKHALYQRVPPQVTYLLTEPLRRNITNQVTDGVTALLTPLLTRSLDISLSHPVADHINARLPQPLATKLSTLLHRSLAHYLINDVPALLRRSLPPALVYSLGRAVTHTVTPTLATTLSRSTEHNHYCYLCFYHQKACWLCGSSAESVYYGSYHAAFYADYFSDYYGAYYTAASTKVANRDSPDSVAKSMGVMDETGIGNGGAPTGAAAAAAQIALMAAKGQVPGAEAGAEAPAEG